MNTRINTRMGRHDVLCNSATNAPGSCAGLVIHHGWMFAGRRDGGSTSISLEAGRHQPVPTGDAETPGRVQRACCTAVGCTGTRPTHWMSPAWAVP